MVDNMVSLDELVTLEEVLLDRAHMDIPLSSGKHTYLDYRPDVITPRLEARLNAFRGRDAESLSQEEKVQAAGAATDFLKAILVDWGLTYANGEKIPPTPDGLMDVPYNVQLFLIQRVYEHLTMGEASGASASDASGSHSSRAERRAASRQQSHHGTR